MSKGRILAGSVSFSGDVTLEVACEMIAELRDFESWRVLRVIGRGPLLFFPHARQNGDGSWRIPARDVRAILGDGLPVWEHAVSAATFAGWCDLKQSRTVLRAVARGEIRSVRILGELRIPACEFFRLKAPVGASDVGSGRRGRPAFSFSRGDSTSSMKEARSP